jgi:hypothetical protein
MAEQKDKAIASLKWANEAYPAVSMVKKIKLGILHFIFNEAGVKGEDRKNATKAFMATPGWFGGSANAMTDSGVMEKQKGSEVKVDEFDIDEEE